MIDDEEAERERTADRVAGLNSARDTLHQLKDLRHEAHVLASTATDPGDMAIARVLLDEVDTVQNRTFERLAEKLKPEPTDSSAVGPDRPSPDQPPG